MAPMQQIGCEIVGLTSGRYKTVPWAHGRAPLHFFFLHAEREATRFSTPSTSEAFLWRAKRAPNAYKRNS